MLGVVGLGFDAENCGVDVLELLGECQLNQEFGGGAWREGANCGASTLEMKDERLETTSAGLKVGVQSGASW